MSVAFLLKPNYNTINNVHHDFYDVEADNIKNSSLNQALEVSTSVKAPVHVVGDTHTISSTAGGIITDAPQFEIPIVISSQVNTDTLLPNLSTTGISVQADLVLDDRNITGVDELTCGTLHYTTLDPAIPSDASAWSTFPATQDVDLSTFALTGTYSLVNIKGSVIADIPTGNIVNQTSTDDASSYAYIRVASAQSDIDKTASLNIHVMGADYTKETSFETLPRSSNLVSYGGDICLIPKDNLQLTYGITNRDKAITINSSGALAFDTDFNGTNPVIPGSFGTAGQIVASQGDALPPQWVDAPTPGDPSTWSDYPAIAAIETANFAIKNTIGQSVDIIAPRLNFTNAGNTELFIHANTDTGDRNAMIHFQNGADNEAASFGYIIQNKPGVAGGLGYLSEPYALNVVSGDNCDLVLTAGINASKNIRLAYDRSKAFTINPKGALAFDSEFFSVEQNIGNFGTAGQIIASQGDALPPHWIDIPPTTSSQYVYYVSKDGAVGATGDVNHPLSTIQAAITLGQAAYPRQVVILIAPGVYTETLSITLPNITLSGYSISQQQNLMTQIVGSVGVSCSASQDLFYSQVCFQNLQISGLLYDNSSVVHTLNIEGCRISSNGAVFAQLSTADNRTRLTRCTILQSSTTASTDPILKFSSGLITLSLLDVTARNNAPVLQFDGSAKMQACGLCTFESTTTSATAAPIVYIAPTSAAGYTYAFGYNSFSYSSLVPRAFSSGKNCGIVCEAGTGHPTLIITYNTFNLLLCDATCFVVQDVKKADAAAYTDIRFFSNSSTYLATGIDSTHKTTLAAVS